MKIFLVFFAAIILFSLPCFSQDTITVNYKEASYNKTIHARAEKIVAALGIDDATKASLVSTIVAEQYKNLNKIYSLRDLQVKTVKEKQAGVTKQAAAEQVKKINEEATAKTNALHKEYIALLSAHLTPVQVNLVKDGMTYNVVHVTYNGYNQMIRTLTDDQKKQIMAWLVEAREYAMDAESADKKHAMFGKYKGRINNYLSAAGYDLRKEGDDWQKRIKEEAEKKKSSQ